jgi:UDP-N-acetylmuramate dehydrogenase
MNLPALRAAFGQRLQENVILAPFTSARIGGPADALITVKSADELAETVARLWEMGVAYTLFGGGSNVLVSDRGVRGVVILNRAKEVRFDSGDQPKVWAEAGAGFSSLAQRAAEEGLSGLEWAAAVPGTVGGAVYGNAGAFGGDMAGNLVYAELLTENGRERWPVEKMEYGYRTSVRKCVSAIAQKRQSGLKSMNSFPSANPPSRPAPVWVRCSRIRREILPGG